MDERTVVESTISADFVQTPPDSVLARLTDVLLSDQGLQALVDEASGATGRRIVVEDTDGRSLAWSQSRATRAPLRSARTACSAA